MLVYQRVQLTSPQEAQALGSAGRRSEIGLSIFQIFRGMLSLYSQRSHKHSPRNHGSVGILRMGFSATPTHMDPWLGLQNEQIPYILPGFRLGVFHLRVMGLSHPHNWRIFSKIWVWKQHELTNKRVVTWFHSSKNSRGNKWDLRTRGRSNDKQWDAIHNTSSAGFCQR